MPLRQLLYKWAELDNGVSMRQLVNNCKSGGELDPKGVLGNLERLWEIQETLTMVI